MNWSLAIARNRAALLAIVAAIAAMLGGRGRDGAPIARKLRNAALALLRPAESATRRLIVMAARGLVLAPRPAPALPVSPTFAGAPGSDATGRLRPPAFRLFDPPKRYVLKLPVLRPAGVPRIRTFWGPPPTALILNPWKDAPVAVPAATADPDAPVAAGRLLVRLAALERALADLPRQARRLARRRGKELAAQRAGRDLGLRPRSPLRLGRPPGHAARAGRPVDLVLAECHALARDALAADTS